MTRTTVPAVERLHNGAPILTKVESHPWENRVTFNPACALVRDGDGLERMLAVLPITNGVRTELLRHRATVFLVYRAQGALTADYDYARSSLGLAVLTPDLRLLARIDHPVVVPQEPYENLGVEDPRIVRVGEQYMMTYTAYASGASRNHVRIATASTVDFLHWTKHGVLEAEFNTYDNKNGMLFEPITGQPLRLLHRPMEGNDSMMIHWAESNSLSGPWKDRGVLMRPVPEPGFKDVWLGGGAPPLALPGGRYLVLYHIGKRRADGAREYDLGIAVYDPQASEPIVSRFEPLLRPETEPETLGDPSLGVNNVLFVCGAYFWDGDLYFPYAGADTCVLGGRIRRQELDRLLASVH